MEYYLLKGYEFLQFNELFNDPFSVFRIGKHHIMYIEIHTYIVNQLIIIRIMIPGIVQSSTKFKFCIPNLNKLEIRMLQFYKRNFKAKNSKNIQFKAQSLTEFALKIFHCWFY